MKNIIFCAFLIIFTLNTFAQNGRNGPSLWEEIRNNSFLEYDDNKPEIIDKAPSGKVYLDGNINVETDSQSIKDRKNLSVNGYLEITLIISNNGSVKKPVISYRGIPEKSEETTFIFDMEDEIMNICRTFSIDNKKQQQNLIETLKQNCRRIVKDKTGKKPFTNINIARI